MADEVPDEDILARCARKRRPDEPHPCDGTSIEAVTRLVLGDAEYERFRSLSIDELIAESAERIREWEVSRKRLFGP